MTCRVVVAPLPSARGRLARLAGLVRAARARGCPLRNRFAPRTPIRAIRRLPRGTWQVRVLGGWQPVDQVAIHRGPCWIHLTGRFSPACASEALASARVQVTVWRHRVDDLAWRRLGVSAGDIAR